MSVICARISGVLRSSCILLGGEINHEDHEGHGEFRIVLSLWGTLAIWGARAASPQCSAACRAEIPPGQASLQCSGSACVSRVGDDVSSSRTFAQELFRRDAESPSRTGVCTRDARVTRKQK